MDRYEYLTIAELFELARHTLSVIEEHTWRYERELGRKCSKIVHDEILCATRVDIAVMQEQYGDILAAIIRRG